MQDVLIEKLMTKGVITVQYEELVTKVAEIFKTHSFHHIPIINDQQCLKGIISRTDFERIKYGVTLFRNPEIDDYNETLFQTLLAKDIMTKGVVHVMPKDSVRRAYKIFKENKFRALPVVEKGVLVGIITPLDILDYYFQSEVV